MNRNLSRTARRVLLTGLAVAATAATALAGAPTASAAPRIDGDLPEYRPANGVVYTFPQVINSGQTLTDQLVEVFGGSMDNGAPVGTWQRLIGDSKASGPIVQANQQWEFRPEASNTGGTIVSGYGQLVNRMSGRCLEVFGGSTAYLASVGQWECNGGPHQLWRADVSMTTGLVALQVKHSGMYLIAYSAQCAVAPTNGQSMRVTTLRGPCTNFKANPVSYRFATRPEEIWANSARSDDMDYYNKCTTGYAMRTRSSGWSSSQKYAFTDVSWNGASAYEVEDFDHNGLHAVVWYSGTRDPYSNTPVQYGQVLLYCDPLVN